MCSTHSCQETLPLVGRNFREIRLLLRKWHLAPVLLEIDKLLFLRHAVPPLWFHQRRVTRHRYTTGSGIDINAAVIRHERDVGVLGGAAQAFAEAGNDTDNGLCR